MSALKPLLFKWTNGVMMPMASDAAREQYHEGARYRLAVHQPPSTETRGHYFACIKEVFEQLSDDLAAEYPSTEHLRKRAMIKCGFCTHMDIVCADESAAIQAIAALRAIDEFAYIIQRDNVVRVYRAETQKDNVMGKARFQESKQKVLETLASLIGVSIEDLGKNAGRAA